MENQEGTAPAGMLRSTALKFIVLLGVVSLLADMTYEGARSITGPYLAVLGASAAAVGTVSGFGELIGYALRFLSGYISDRTRRYWGITIFGYAVNLLAVPLLALAGHWPLAATLIIVERVGKAIRVPARDAMLSHATHQVGHGWGFGLHEALDQIGAVLGPLVVAAVLYFRAPYQVGFAVLLVPALLALAVLAVARYLYPNPRDLEVASPHIATKGFRPVFWWYLAAVALIAAGYADFPLIAYHFQKGLAMPSDWIPVFYATAMAVDAVSALICGRWFDRIGLTVLAIAAGLSALFAPLVFLGGAGLALLGVVLWGVGMGAQESVMRAAVAQLVPPDRRGVGYGVFNTGYGVFWFLGSALMGVLYDVAIPALVVFSVAVQIAAVVLLLATRSRTRAAV
jgi:MFS family permease